MTGQWQGTAAEWDHQLAMVMRDQSCGQEAAWTIVSANIGPRPAEAPAAQVPPWQGPGNGQAGPSPGARGSVRGPRDRLEFFAFWKGDEIDLAETVRHLPCNEQDAAELIAGTWFPGELHYVPGLAGRPGIWHVWDDRCHRPDSDGRAAKIVARFAHEVPLALERCRQAIYARVVLEMPGATPADQDKEVDRRWAKDWKAAAGYAAGVKRATGARALLYQLSVICSVDGSVFDDHHPRSLNCLNGTVDLQTGEIRPHNPADMITYCVPVDYDPRAARPVMFCELVWRMTGHSPAVYAYVMRALGYSLLGENPEQVIFFINGETKSGKSQVLYIVRQLLGTLAHESQASLITVERNGRNARVMNSIRGKRIFTITETSAFMHIDEGQLKRLTGEPVISVDRHYAPEELRTPVTFTGWIATNDMPSLTNYDDAMNERINVIPGGPTIPPEQRDKRLAEKIIATEGAAVLAYLVRECVAYHAPAEQGGGLPMPPEVAAETAKYRGQQNTAASFIAECCLQGGHGSWVEMTDSRSWYMAWMRQRGSGQMLGLQAFYDHMAAHPWVSRQDNGGSIRRFYGLQWNQDAINRLL